jgi:hypothetical protein
MGVRVGSSWSNTPLGNLPAGDADTLLFTTPLLCLAADGNAVFIQWLLSFTPSSGTTGLGVNIHRGATLGSPSITVSPWVETGISNVALFLSGCYFDLPGQGIVQYSLSVALQGSPSSPVTITDGGIYAFML